MLWLDWLPLGVPGQWVWLRRMSPLPLDLPAGIVALALLLAAAVVLMAVRSDRKLTGARTALLLGVVVVATAVAAVAPAYQGPTFWVNGGLAVISDTSMGYYSQALCLSSISDAFSHHGARVASRQVPDRVRTHPPGPIAFFYLLHRCLRNSPQLLDQMEAALARRGVSSVQLHHLASRLTPLPLNHRDVLVAIPIVFILTGLGALMVLPAYGIGAVAFDRRTGLLAALLTASIPSLLHFAPSIEAVGAVLALGFLWLWMVAVRRGSLWLYLLSALAASVMLLWSFGYGILLIVAVAVALPVWGQALPAELGRHLRGAAWAIVAFAVFHQVLSSALEYNILAEFPASLKVHRQILVAAGRDYWLWLPMNLYDFVLFMGPALAVMSVVGIRSGLRQARWPALAQGLVIGLLIVLGLLLISGATRAEVGRIWLFLMPLAAVVAANFLLQASQSKLLWIGSGLVAVQICFTLAIRAVLVPVWPF